MTVFKIQYFTVFLCEDNEKESVFLSMKETAESEKIRELISSIYEKGVLSCDEVFSAGSIPETDSKYLNEFYKALKISQKMKSPIRLTEDLKFIPHDETDDEI